MANITGKFRFHGISSHAAGAPERGRSALDGVEVMNVMTNFLREHVPDGTRIHYVVTNGGKAPNVVPDEAEVYYYVRHVDMNVVNDVWSRVVNAAKGAAIGTGTTYDLQLIGSVYALLPNETLARVQQRALERFENLSVVAIDPEATAALGRLAARSMKLSCTVQDGQVWIGDVADGDGVNLTPAWWRGTRLDEGA
jgi:metal-dependent amidase/aminoacylase/carboxypeptidase family protein